jgi:alpha-1,2-mannosyltransferase
VSDASPVSARRPHLQVACALALLAVGALVGVLVVASQTGSSTGLLDLRIYLGAAASLRDGGSAYAYTDATYGLGSTYPPLWSIALVPLTSADIHLVEHLWVLVGLAVWFVTMRLVQLFPLGVPSVRSLLAPQDHAAEYLTCCTVWFLSLFTAPVWNTVNQGQVNFVIWLLIVVDVGFVAWNRSTGGAYVGLASALKLTPAVFALSYLVAGRRAAVGRAAAAFLGATLLAAAIAWSDSRRYWTELVFQSSRVGDLTAAENNSLAGLLARLGVPDSAAVLIGCGLAVVLLVASRRPMQEALRRRDVAWLAITVGAIGSLMSPVSWTHHLLFLAFLLLMIVRRTDLSPLRRGALLLAVEVVLIDPVGFGRSPVTSSVRTLLLVGLVVGLGRLVPPTGQGRAPASAAR